MGVNISGKGVLSGIATLVAGVVQSFNLLVTRIIGYTNVPGTGGSSYYTTTQGELVPGSVFFSIKGEGFYTTDGVTTSRTSPESIGDLTDIPRPNPSVSPSNSWSNAVYNEELGNWRITSGTGYNVESIDGINWTRANRGVLSSIYDATNYSSTENIVEYLNGKFWTFGTNEANDENMITTTKTVYPLWSTDGSYWESPNEIPSGFFTYDQMLASYGQLRIVYLPWNQKYVVVKRTSYSQNKSIYTTNAEGTSWSLSNSSAIPNGVVSLSEPVIVYPGTSNERLIVIGENNGEVYYTQDGSVWTETDTENTLPVSIQNSQYYLYVTENNVLVAINVDANNTYLAAYVSVDGGNSWTLSTTQNNIYFINFESIGNQLFIYARDSVTYDTISVYFDGSSWYRVASNHIGSSYRIDNIDGVLYQGGYNSLIVSTDGINWSEFGIIRSFSYPVLSGYGAGKISTLREVQVLIGNQGEEGAEILAPIDVYTVPNAKTTNIDEVTVKNNSANTITYDLGVLNAGVSLTDQNALVNDQAISAGATATVTNISSPLTAGQRIVVFPSAVDVVEVKVYGTETSLPVLVAAGQGFSSNSKEFGYTYDGQSWTLLDTTASRYKDVIYANNKFVAAGNGYMAYSLDGIAWVETSVPREYKNITYGNGTFAAISEWEGAGSYILTSSDGITWSESALSGEVQSIAYGNGTFVLSSYYQFATSSNAVDWTYANYPSTEYSIVINKLKFINNKFVGVGSSGGLAISTDGISWTIDSTKSASNVEYINGKYYAPGANQFWSSTDGITWSGANPTGTAFERKSIAYGNGKFVVVGNGRIEYSTDGENWTTETYSSKMFAGVKFFNNKFVVIGTDGMTMGGLSGYSEDGETWTISSSNLSSYSGSMANN
jgi:hypothetical protein